MITVVAVGAGKVAYKIGSKVFANADEAWQAYRQLQRSGGRVADDVAGTPVGRSGESPLNVLTHNFPTTIDGTKFTGHALDQMQARGILSPSAVLDVVKNPARTFSGNTPGTTVYIKDNLRVITNNAGDIVSVIPQ